MTVDELLNHLEWLAGGIATTAVTACTALYWVWSYGASALEKACSRLEKVDEAIRQDIDGVRAQVTAFQTDMYTKEMGGALESRIVTRIDRVEDKIDDRMDRLGDKFDEFMRICK